MAVQQVAALVGDYYHTPGPVQETLQQTASSIGVALSFFTDPALLPWDSLRDFRGLVMVKENRTTPAESNAIWATPRHEAAIAEFALAQSADHPLLAGFAPFELADEMYFVRVDSARTTPLLELFHPDYGTSCAAWAHTVGSGRVFCFTLGHTTDVLDNTGYRRFLERGQRWALRIEMS